jgi:hypothetical protein
LQKYPSTLIGKPLAVFTTAGAWSLAPNLANTCEFDIRGKVVASKELVDAQHAKEPNVPYRIVNSVTGEVLKTFPEHSNEQLMNANKNYCVLRTLAAQGVI